MPLAVSTISPPAHSRGRSLVTVQFNLTTNPNVALQDVREKVAAIRSQLRKEVDEPTITRFNPDDLPIVSVAVESETMKLRDLTTLADQLIVEASASRPRRPAGQASSAAPSARSKSGSSPNLCRRSTLASTR